MGAIDRTYPRNLSMKERRTMWRYPMELDASLWPKTGSSHPVVIVDLSITGAGVEPPKDLDVGSTGVLRIDSGRESLRLPYSVLWTRTVNGLRRAGLGFFLMDAVKQQLAFLLDTLTDG